DLKLPFDAYKPAPGQRALLNTAHRALVARCLKRRGVKPRTPLPAAPVDPGNSRRYGVADPEQARLYGYHLPTETPSRAKKARRVRGTGGGPAGSVGPGAVALAGPARRPHPRTLRRTPRRPRRRGALGGVHESRGPPVPVTGGRDRRLPLGPGETRDQRRREA